MHGARPGVGEGAAGDRQEDPVVGRGVEGQLDDAVVRAVADLRSSSRVVPQAWSAAPPVPTVNYADAVGRIGHGRIASVAPDFIGADRS